MDKEIKILVECKGGLVTAVSSNNPNVKIVVVDYDSEDWDDKGELGATIQGSACVSNILSPDRVDDKLSNLFEDEEDSKTKYTKEKLKELNF